MSASVIGGALGGAPLWGHKLMRLTYFDDCGLFNPLQEPFIIVAGVVIDADISMIAVEDHLDRLIFKHIPEKDADGFVFHATDLYSGSEYFDKRKWDYDKRMEILMDLASVPARFGLQVAFGHQDRKFIPNYNFPSGTSEKEKELTVFTDVFARFCEQVEKFMRDNAPNEVTILIGEHRDSIQNRLRDAHAIYRNHARVMKINPLLKYFPFHHIRDTVHLARKGDSAHLQIADTCAFIIKRKMMKDTRISKHFEAIRSQMLVLPPDELKG